MYNYQLLIWIGSENSWYLKGSAGRDYTTRLGYHNFGY
jgi:hypothetical protein